MIVSDEVLVEKFALSPLELSTGVAGGEDDDAIGGDGGESSTGVITESKPKTKKPSMYKVLMLNDDYTPMEFVVHVLVRFFSKSHEDATKIMLHVHQRGVGVCGIYPYEIAESKVTQVVDFARKHQHPLQCTLEKD
ncbi:MAG: ATP-dependent Clp protease adapter ClpS [Alphaproteobacteria bacterium]|nr:ATP-dependent Clp protease adapter ClpS [Alphaproteobacteria bacterium]